MALRWLETCRRDHPTCEAIDERRDPKWYPKRLIDIGEASGAAPRLVITGRQGQPTGRYAALSYCWGPNPSFLTLNGDRLLDFQREIPVERLPRGFVDSIVTCRRLGLRYLWIDGLCILQSGPGSKEDWLLHANEMHKVYTNCHLNIAIANASCPEEGAFVDRDPSFLQVCLAHMPVQGSPSTSRLCTVFARDFDFQIALWDTPLQKRGWVAQERLMSPRTLHFGSDRIFWECNEESLLSEYLPEGLPHGGIAPLDPHTPRNFNLPARVLAREPLEDPKVRAEVAEEALRAWYNVLEHYTACSLTYPDKDKLVAISAVARRLGESLGHRYFAGLFYADLPGGLTWSGSLPSRNYFGSWGDHTFLGCLDPPREPGYRAPSWSWASLNDPVAFNSVVWVLNAPEFQAQCRPIAVVEDISVELLDPENKYGPVKSAQLVIRGILIPGADHEFASKVEVQVEAPELLPSAPETYMLFIYAVYRGPSMSQRSAQGLLLDRRDDDTYARKGSFYIKLKVEEFEKKYGRKTIKMV